MSGQGGRYQRSFSGMVGALLATLLAIGVFLAFRAIGRDDLESGPEPIDYLTQVGYAQDAGAEVVYPASLPDGWVATSITLGREQPPTWGLGILTDEGAFVGIRQEDEDLDDLLEAFVDEAGVAEEPDLEVEGSVAPRWQAFSDAGGDHAYAAEVGGQQVLVYGSAPVADLETVVEALTTAPR